ncbi:unnamed protein product [Knipowitschia caucasica]
MCLCAPCSVVPPVCDEGETLRVDLNTTDRCCPLYSCGQ